MDDRQQATATDYDNAVAIAAMAWAVLAVADA